MACQTRILLLVVSHISIDVALLVIEGWLPGSINAGWRLLVITQAGLIGVWAVFGSLSWQFRVPLSVGTVACLAIISVGIPASTQLGLWGANVVEAAERLGGVFTLAGAFAFLTRLAGLRVSCIGPDSVQRERRAQFTVRQIMLFTFVVAATIGAPEVVQPFAEGLHPKIRPFVLGPLGVGLVCAAASWAILRPGTPVFRSTMTLMVAYAFAKSFARPLQALDAVAVYLLLAIICMVSLLVVRSAGYRFAKKRGRE